MSLVTFGYGVFFGTLGLFGLFLLASAIVWMVWSSVLMLKEFVCHPWLYSKIFLGSIAEDIRQTRLPFVYTFAAIIITLFIMGSCA